MVASGQLRSRDGSGNTEDRERGIETRRPRKPSSQRKHKMTSKQLNSNSKSIPINNYVENKWTKISPQRRSSGRMGRSSHSHLRAACTRLTRR